MDMGIIPMGLLALALVVQLLVVVMIAGGDDRSALVAQGCVAAIIILFVLVDMSEKGAL